MLVNAPLPNIQKFSILLASVLMAFSIARFVQLPGLPLEFTFGGIFLSFEININTFIALIVAGLTASGADWLIRDHPMGSGKSGVENWLLPALTAWVISFPLSFLTDTALWWVGFITAGVVLLTIILAEYIAADPSDDRWPIASVVLIAVSFMLLLILMISLRSIGLRLIFTLPAIGFATFLVSLRAANLRLHGKWLVSQVLVVTLVTIQFVAALHYLPLNPTAYGLLILGLTYTLVNFIVNLEESAILRRAIMESSIMLLLIFSLTAIIS